MLNPFPFKVGDKVKITTNSHPWLERGTVVYIWDIEFGSHYDSIDRVVETYLDIAVGIVPPEQMRQNISKFYVCVEDFEVIEENDG